MDISFLIPTNREYNRNARRVIDSIRNCAKGYKYEILTFSKFEIPDTRWFPEDYCRYPELGLFGQGEIYGLNWMYRNSLGKYVVICTDGTIFSKKLLTAIDVLKNDYKDKKFKIISVPTIGQNEFFINHVPGSEHLPKFVIPRYPVFDKETIEKELQGFIFNPFFKHHYADNWLGYYMGINGQNPQENRQDSGIVKLESNHRTNHDVYDKSVFDMLIKYKLKYSGCPYVKLL